MPLANDLQNILIRQRMSIKQVAENDMDFLFEEIERIRELYIKVGSNDDPISEKWFRAAVLQNLPAKVVQDIAIEVTKAESIEEMFDHRTWLPKGQSNTMLYLTEGGTEDNSQGTPSKNANNKPEEAIKGNNAKTESADNENNELYANTKGQKGRGKGKVCWQCGGAGHFQRECPKGPVQSKDTYTIAALKGKSGYKGGYGKGKQGKYGKSNSKGGCGNKNNWYRAPGKAIGKGGINYHGYSQEDDYYNAWGYEEDNWDYGVEDESYNNYYLGIVATLLENDDTDIKSGRGEDEASIVYRSGSSASQLEPYFRTPCEFTDQTTVMTVVARDLNTFRTILELKMFSAPTLCARTCLSFKYQLLQWENSIRHNCYLANLLARLSFEQHYSSKQKNLPWLQT